MAIIMDCDGIITLANELIDENPGNLHSPEGYLAHLKDTYDISGEIVDIAISLYPELSDYLNRDEIALAGGLHDIGRPLEENQLFHELRGAEYIEIHGLEKGVADSIEDLYRIAQMIRPHYVVSEQVGDPENREHLDEFGLLDSDLLIPRTWQESIIIYAELSNVDGRKVSIKERVDDVKDRYINDPRYNTNTSLVKAMETGLDRVLNVCDRVQNLIDGKYELEEIMRYGFI